MTVTSRLLAAAAAAAILLPVTATAQAQVPARTAFCVAANDEVTRHRLGKDRAGRPYPVNVGQAVAAGRRADARCRADGGFLLAYALARIDLAKDVKASSVENRTANFNSALADLDLVKRLVLAGKSDRYEVFNTLGLIYHETKQYEKAIAVLNQSAPVLNKLSLRSKQNTFFTRGLAQLELGRSAEAGASFAQAKKLGHPQAAQWEARTRRRK